MKSIREITKQYNELLQNVDNNEFYTKKRIGRVNCYICSKCGHITKTRDIDAGVTPFMHNCEKCDSLAESTFYNDVLIGTAPTQEWYRPSLRECFKIRKNEALLEHILRGGLIVRTIKK